MFSYDQLFQAYQKDKFVLVSHTSLKAPYYQTLAGFNTELSYFFYFLLLLFFNIF